MCSKIIISGASGFVGSNFLKNLNCDDEVILLTHKNKDLGIHQARYRKIEIRDDMDFRIFEGATFMHFGWPHLDNFMDHRHLTDALKFNVEFLKRVIDSNVNRLVVTGTCLEYGRQEGGIYPDAYTDPCIPYAIAKNALYQFLRELEAKYNFNLVWARIFYLYGRGQNEKSLLPSLQNAILKNEEIFPMSMGDQLRDFIHISEAIKMLDSCRITNKTGVVNISSGKPQSVIEFVEKFLKSQNAEIKLKLGVYDIPSYEPYNFWGLNY